VDILARAGYPKAVMINTLTWLIQSEGAGSGGLLASLQGRKNESRR